MDALEFLKERKRMCDYYSHCKGCPLDGSKCVIDSAVSDENCKRFAATVEQWSKEHPRKTRQSEFLKLFPETELKRDGVIAICPFAISAAYRSEEGLCANPSKNCLGCRREFWMQEVE